MSTIPKSKRDESSWLTPTQTKEELLVADLQSAASKVHHEQQHFITSGGNNNVGNVISPRTSTSDIEKDRLEMQLSQAIDSAVHLREANKELARTVLVSEQNIAAMDTEIKQLKAEGQEYKTQLNKIRLSSSSSSSSSSLLASPGKNIAVNYTAQAARTQQVLAQTQSLVFSLRSTFQSASTQLKSWQRSELENIAKLKRAIPSLRVSTTQLPSSPFLSNTGVLRSPESSPLARSQHTDKSMSRSDVESNASGNVGSNDNGDAEVSFADPDTTFSADDAKLVPLMRMQADLKGRLVAALAEAADERLRSQQLSIRIIELEENLEKAATPSIAQNALLVETLEKLAKAQSASGVALAAAAASKSALMSAEIQLRASKAELAAVLDEVQLMKEESEQQYMMSNNSSGGGGGEGRIINNSLSIDSITGLDISQTSYQSDNYTNNKAVADATAIAVQKAAEGAAAAASAAYSHSLSEIRASYESRLVTYRAEADSTKEVVASELASLHAAYLSASKDRDNASASLSACVAAFENERVALMRKIEELEENMHHSNLPPPLTTTVEEGNRTLETHHPIEPSATVETPLSSPKSSSDTDTSVSSSTSSSSSSHSHSKSLVRRPTMRVIERSPATTIVSFVPADPAISASSDAVAAATTTTTAATTAAEASSSSSTTSNTSSSSLTSSSNLTSSSSSSSSSSNVSSPAVVLKSTYSSNSLARSGSFFALNPTTGQIHTPSSSIRESERERQESVIAQLTAELTQMRAEASDRELRWQQVALSHSLKWQGQLIDSQKRLEFVEREKEKLLFEMNENEQVRMSQLQASRASAVQARRALDAAVKAASVKEATLENAKRRLISEQQTLVTALREDAMTAKKIFEAEIVTLRGIVTAKDKAIETLKLELLPQKRRVFAEEEIKAQLREAQLVAAQLVERQGQLKSEKEAAEAVASAALQSSKQESHNVAARLSASIPFHVNAITKDIQKEADKLHEDLEEVRTLLRTVTLERDEAIERLKSKEEAANKAVKIAATLQRLADSTNVYGKTTSPRKNRAKNDINQETDDTNGVDGSTRGRSRSVATVAGTVVDPLSNATLFAAGALSPASIKKRILSRTSKEALLQSGMTLSHRATSSSSTLTPHIDSLGGPSPALPAVLPIHTMSATQMLLSPRTSITKQQQQQQEKEMTRKTPQSQHSLSSSSSSNGTSGDSLVSPRSSSTVRFKSASPPGQHETRRLRSASPNPSSLNHPVDPKFIVAVKGRRGRVALRLGVAALFMYSVLKREKLRNAFNTLRIHDLQQKSNNLAIIMKELVSIFGVEVVQSMPPATLIKTRYIALAQTAHDLSIAAQNALADATLLGKKAESLTQTTQELTIKLQNERESLAASNEDARKLHKALGETEAMRLELEVQVTPLKAQVQKLHVAEAERNKAIERLKSIESSSESLRSDIINLRAANSRLSIERGFLASISDLLESCSKDPANATTSSLNTIKTDALSSDLILLKENALSIATVIKSKTNTVKTLESELHSTSNALTGSQRHREASEVHAARARASLDTAEIEIKELKDKLVLALKGREEIEKGRSGLINTAREHEEKEEKMLDDLKKEKERSLKLQSELEHSIKRATDLATSKASIESENVRLKGTLASALAANTSTLSSQSSSSIEPQNSVVSGITPRRSAPPPPSK